MSQNLQYNYAIIDLSNYQCVGCITSTYKVNHATYIEVPVYSDYYCDKYYNPNDGLFYYEPEYINVFDPEA